MTSINSETEYKAIMSRIEQLFFETDENTPKDDTRLIELNHLSELVEIYETLHHNINL